MKKRKIEDSIMFEKGQHAMAEKVGRVFAHLPEVLLFSQKMKEKHYTGIKRAYKELENE